MYKRYYIVGLLFLLLFIACDNNSTNSTNGKSNERQAHASPIKEDVDSNFNDFIDQFSTDSTFQLSRTKFPLKTKWYDLDNGKDSLIYKDRSSFEMIDLSKKKSTGQEDQWERKIVIDKKNTSAIIEIRGIDNGIIVDYLFKKINGAWMLIEIDDSST
jgi:hypothetical protein